MSRRSLLAMVHIAKKDLGLDDDTYRDVLRRVTGASSSKALSEHELERVVAEFRRKGWTPKTRTKSSKPAIRLIWALWREMRRSRVHDGDAAALRTFVHRMTGVSDPEWLAPEQATTVIEALKQWRSRATRERAKKEGG
jgi:phage gp16-like protein